MLLYTGFDISLKNKNHVMHRNFIEGYLKRCYYFLSCAKAFYYSKIISEIRNFGSLFSHTNVK